MPCFLAAPHTPSSTTSASTAACSFAVYRRLFLAAIFYSSHPNRLRTVRNFRLWNGWSDGRQEQLLSQQRGEPIKDSFEEVFISSPKVYHFMVAIKEKGAVVVMVTKKSTNQGMGWAALRNALASIKDTLP